MKNYILFFALSIMILSLSGGLAHAKNNKGTNNYQGMDRNHHGVSTTADSFGELDANNDGYLSRNEWNNTNQSFDQLDLNHGGKLSRDEFYNRSRIPVAVFSELDVNTDGRISRSEWRSDTATFTRLDTNGNNLLSENEFNGSQSSSLVEKVFQEIFRKR